MVADLTSANNLVRAQINICIGGSTTTATNSFVQTFVLLSARQHKSILVILRVTSCVSKISYFFISLFQILHWMFDILNDPIEEWSTIKF